MKKIITVFLVVVCFIVPFEAKAVSTSAKAAILINGDTGEVIYAQNESTTLPMASTTKIMTALLLCENGDFEKEITVTAEMLKVEGSSMGLLAGDTVTLKDLLYGMLLASGNDAANVTAYVLGGTVDGFVNKMNLRAKQLGLLNTHFETPSGLDGDSHYTTAADLAKLARFALQNEAFALAASSKSAVLNYGNPPYRRSLSNHNKLLKTFDGAIGVKTGFTKKSGRCLVSAAKRDGKYVIAVTLNDPNDWRDHTALLEYGFNAIKLTEISPELNDFNISVIGGDKENISINVEPIEVSYLKNGDFSCTVNLPKFLYAPVKRGEIIGNAVFKRDGVVIKTIELASQQDVEELPIKRKTTDIIIENIKNIFINIWEK